MSWRRQQGKVGDHSGCYSQPWKNHWSSLQKKRKPQDHSLSVPGWEKQFCMRAGSVPWGKLVETKKYMLSLHKNIVQWNDSAGEEAFNDAKSRFWAEINGLSCNISLPDPDAYIDDVDWSSSNIDPEVILDLERSREPKPYYYDNGETLDPEAVVIIGLHLTVSNKTVACTGWGDSEEDLKNKENIHENPWEPASGHQSKAAARVKDGAATLVTSGRIIAHVINGRLVIVIMEEVIMEFLGEISSPIKLEGGGGRRNKVHVGDEIT
ncbi:uncharacterized protein Pyn_33217 [Prunus yedoensis var. nudiflora]|uniref:Uncharacterized protein n=1 Tax=Prunus yedoensis var. nudiflora TaxID=2094558 RepID=A0A314Y795_PRUYE|nr:uncharacterized protein Pyn_33217 [Prunus yedoensis var. nudiflora]